MRHQQKLIQEVWHCLEWQVHLVPCKAFSPEILREKAGIWIGPLRAYVVWPGKRCTSREICVELCTTYFGMLFVSRATLTVTAAARPKLSRLLCKLSRLLDSIAGAFDAPQMCNGCSNATGSLPLPFKVLSGKCTWCHARLSVLRFCRKRQGFGSAPFGPMLFGQVKDALPDQFAWSFVRLISWHTVCEPGNAHCDCCCKAKIEQAAVQTEQAAWFNWWCFLRASCQLVFHLMLFRCSLPLHFKVLSGKCTWCLTRLSVLRFCGKRQGFGSAPFGHLLFGQVKDALPAQFAWSFVRLISWHTVCEPGNAHCDCCCKAKTEQAAVQTELAAWFNWWCFLRGKLPASFPLMLQMCNGFMFKRNWLIAFAF